MRKIEGRNPVLEALKAERKIKKLVIQEGATGKIVNQIVRLAEERDIPYERVNKSAMNDQIESTAHQGVLALAEDYPYVDLYNILEYAETKGEPPLVVILDEIQDPHNLGSIIRTANIAGVHGVIIPKHRACEVTSTVAKTSAGAVEHTRVAQVTNIAQTIDQLKEAGLWIAGTALVTDRVLYKTDLKGPLGIVIGNEGGGLRRLVQEKCDFIVQIPMFGQINSLNASVAFGIMIYEVVRQRNYDHRDK